jgi:hypothetical protein
MLKRIPQLLQGTERRTLSPVVSGERAWQVAWDSTVTIRGWRMAVLWAAITVAANLLALVIAKKSDDMKPYVWATAITAAVALAVGTLELAYRRLTAPAAELHERLTTANERIAALEHAYADLSRPTVPKVECVTQLREVDGYIMGVLGIKNTGSADDFTVEVVARSMSNEKMVSITPAALRWLDTNDALRPIAPGMTAYLDVIRFSRHEMDEESAKFAGKNPLVVTLSAEWENHGDGTLHARVFSDEWNQGVVMNLCLAIHANGCSHSARTGFGIHVIKNSDDDPTGKRQFFKMGDLMYPIMRLRLFDPSANDFAPPPEWRSGEPHRAIGHLAP